MIRKNNLRNSISGTHSKRDVKGIKWVATNVKGENLSHKFSNKREDKITRKKDFFNFLNVKNSNVKNNKEDLNKIKLIENKDNIKNFINRIIGKKEESKIRVKKNRNIIEVYKINNLKAQRCKKCHRLIIEMSSAIYVDDSYYLHFECALKDITEKKRELIKNNKLVYLGSNTFGVVEFYKEEGKTKFKIKEKIPLSKINVV